MSFDRRLTAARPDLAAEHLRSAVVAERYAGAVPHCVHAATTRLWPGPDASLAPDTELLLGEAFDVYEIRDGWAWGQSELDGYVGYLRADTLGSGDDHAPTHRVSVLTGHLYSDATLKLPVQQALPYGARLTVHETRDRHAELADGLFIPLPQISSLDHPAPDWVAEAERFLGVGYVWGGRSSWGLDCSALVQLSRQAAGLECPRDSDMQAEGLGETLPEGADLMRGDLIFWKGHVGIMRDAETLLHANAHHMAVTTEPLVTAIERIEAAGDGKVTRRARLDEDPNTP